MFHNARNKARAAVIGGMATLMVVGSGAVASASSHQHPELTEAPYYGPTIWGSIWGVLNGFHPWA